MGIKPKVSFSFPFLLNHSNSCFYYLWYFYFLEVVKPKNFLDYMYACMYLHGHVYMMYRWVECWSQWNSERVLHSLRCSCKLLWAIRHGCSETELRASPGAVHGLSHWESISFGHFLFLIAIITLARDGFEGSNKIRGLNCSQPKTLPYVFKVLQNVKSKETTMGHCFDLCPRCSLL